MGLDTNGIKFLLSCKRKDVCFDKTLMIGRQILNLDLEELKSNLDLFNYNLTSEQIKKELYDLSGGYGEGVLKLLGAKEIDSLDYSNYEGANILHDMNYPVNQSMYQQYDVVLESGSLEHIFNFPVSIANCMNMVKQGGHFLLSTPVNNIMGHGFYQFSPEVFFRVVNPESGFEIERMIVFEYSADQQWYSVVDPKIVKQRVELLNSSATYLMMQARRVSVKPILAKFPQQSDYEDAWQGLENYYTKIAQDRDNHPRNQESSVPVRKIIKQFVPEFLLNLYRAYVFTQKVKFDPKFYKKIKPTD